MGIVESTPVVRPFSLSSVLFVRAPSVVVVGRQTVSGPSSTREGEERGSLSSVLKSGADPRLDPGVRVAKV